MYDNHLKTRWLAYKILEVTYQNMDTNIYFKGEKKFWTLHKEAFADLLP